MHVEPASPQRHQCLIYDGAPSRHLDALSETIIERLKTNHRCLYLNSPPMVAGMRARLAAAGLNLVEYIEGGALVLTSDQGHLLQGKFDVDRMLGLLDQAVRQALDDGYVGLWATGDMTWELGSEINPDKLLDYERRLEEYMHNTPALSGVCQYHRATLPAHAIDVALETHPSRYINATLSRLNRKYRHI
jgi:hypothetical protein